MKNWTIFDAAKFCRAPQFAGAKLHEGTRWHGVRWPKPPKDAMAAQKYIDAYERLKLEMDRMKKHGDELDFFARELEVSAGAAWFLERPSHCALRRSVRSRAILHASTGDFAGTIVLGAIPLWAYFGGSWALATFADLSHAPGALGVSFANTFGVLGIRRDFINPDVFLCMPSWLKFFSIVQTVIGIVLVFLFGLSIRNRFRMR